MLGSKFQSGNVFSLVMKLVLFATLILPLACSQSNFDNGSGETGGNDPQNESCDLFFNQVGYCANFIWERVPNTEHGGSFYLEFAKQSDPTLPSSPNFRLSVDEWMPSMSHPPQNVAIRATGSPGQFYVQDARIYMDGVWSIRVQMLNGAGQVVDEATYSYNRL